MTSQSSIIVNEIYKSRKNILSHLKNQHYDVSGYNDFSVHEVNIMHTNEQLDMLVEKKDKENIIRSKVYIKYYLGKVLRHTNIHDIVEDLFTIENMLNKETDTLIIIAKDDLNDRNTATVNYIWETDKTFVVVFGLKQLQFNILEHSLVPAHRVLSPDEKLEILKKYNMKCASLLPEISRFDPVAKAIGIRPTEVCEIIRPSKSAIQSLYYRICV